MNKRAAAWEWTLHMELGQKDIRLTNRKENPFGSPGRDYSPEFLVTVRKLIYASENRGGK